MSSLVYACVIAGVATFSDRPCVERPSPPPVEVTLRETPPRFPEVVSTGSSFQATGFDRRGRPVGYWVRLGTAVPYVHKHGRRGR
jgi:hypothetical protein